MKHLQHRQIENYDYIRAAQQLQDSLFREPTQYPESDGKVTLEMQGMKMTCHIDDLEKLLTTFTGVSM